MHDKTRDEFLNDLCPHIRPIIIQIMTCDCGCEALDLFQKRPRTWNESADIAYLLKRSVQEVIPTLHHLLDLNVIQYREIFGTPYYRLTEDTEVLEALDQYWTWRGVWRSGWQQMQSSLKL